MAPPPDTAPSPPDATIERPVFPLQTVLFPGSTLPLRIFEIRYVDMVRQCLREGSDFVVARITHGGEVGEAAAHESIGTLAAITHWDMAPGGLLHILIEGRGRVRLSARRVDHGLVRARAEILPEEADQALPARYAACGEIARRIAGQMFDAEAVEVGQGSTGSTSGEQGKRDNRGKSGEVGAPPAGTGRVLPRPWRFDSATWVSRRLSEWLPLEGADRQALLELDDPVRRLEHLWPVLIEHGWVRPQAAPSAGS